MGRRGRIAFFHASKPNIEKNTQACLNIRIDIIWRALVGKEKLNGQADNKKKKNTQHTHTQTFAFYLGSSDVQIMHTIVMKVHGNIPGQTKAAERKYLKETNLADIDKQTHTHTHTHTHTLTHTYTQVFIALAFLLACFYFQFISFFFYFGLQIYSSVVASFFFPLFLHSLVKRSESRCSLVLRRLP